MRRRKKDTMNDLVKLLNDFLDGELIVPEVELPEVEDLKDYLHREDRIINLMKERAPKKKLVAKGSLLEQIIAKLARRKRRGTLSACYRAALRQAGVYVNKLFVDILNDVPDVVERLSEAIGLEFTKEDISLDEVIYPVLKHTKIDCLVLNKYIFKDRFGRDCKLCFYNLFGTSDKLRRAVYSPKGDDKAWRKYLGLDMIAAVVLFNIVTATGKEDENRKVWLERLAADAIRASEKTENRYSALSNTTLTEKLLSGYDVDITDFTGIHPTDITFIASALEYLAEEYRIERNYKEYYEKAARTARSFETKKNIPEATLRLMANSKFNNYFGYVEFDETTDLENADEVYKDFVAINDKFFGGLKTPDVSLRFRLLGRHHAWGLYYPTLACMCVDVRHPSSFIHEYFHMYDYTHGELSRSYEFGKIRDVYAGFIYEWYDSLDRDVRSRLRRTKYGVEYYLLPTEVFARCGEIYISRIKGVVNSCCALSQDLGFAYPKDSELEKLIGEYFDKLLPNATKKEELEEAEAATKKVAASDITL